MSRVIGIVCEGPTDYEVIRRVVNTLTEEKNDCLRLHPDETLAGHFGNGWKGVWRWCESHGPILNDYMTKATPKLDCLIVQMDGDVSRKEKEVHCACAATVCGQSGDVHPLGCRTCRSGQCPVKLPCASHGTDSYPTHLRGLITSWLGLATQENAPVIITVPCDSIDTWVAVAYGDLTERCEAHPDTWDSIIARGAYYHSIRIQGHKKRVPVYKILADTVSKNWETVKRLCPQAQAFELALLETLPKE